MKIASPLALAAAIGLAALGAPVQQAQASLANAALQCIVDTYAYDEPGIGQCHSFWTPWSASNPTTAFFNVVGLPAGGNYQYFWSLSGCGDSPTCSVSIWVESSITATVTILDHSTSTFKQVSATAYYWDGFN